MSKLIVNTIEAQTYKYDSDTTGLTLNSDGSMTRPNQVRFFARLSSDYAFSAGANGNWSTDDASWSTTINVGSGFSGGKFTAPVAGHYMFYASFYANPHSSSSYHGCYFHGSGVDSTTYGFYASEGANDTATSLSAMYDMAANEEIKLAHYPSGSGTLKVSGTFWYGYLMG